MEGRLSFRSFIFNFFVYFLPNLITAFQTTNPSRYYGLAYLMFSQMLFKQIAMNLIEAITPLLLIRPTLNEVRNKFWPIRIGFIDEENIDAVLKAEGRTVEQADPSHNKVMPEADHSSPSRQLYSVQNNSMVGMNQQQIWYTMKMDEARQELENEVKNEKEAADSENPDLIPKDPKDIRLYQIKRDLVLDPNPPDIINNYMELVVQFGFIVLFSVVFPLAAPLSLIANLIQLDTQKQNMIYSRRFKAEIANGIGPWLEILSVISKIAVIVNMGCLFFTSSVAKAMFAGVDYEHLMWNIQAAIGGNGNPSERTLTLDDNLASEILLAGIEPTTEAAALAEALGVEILEPTWDVFDFFLTLVLVEHGLILFNMFLEIAIPDAPQDAVEGARNTAELI